MDTFTSHAATVLLGYRSYTRAVETLDHDGFDMYGAESNLWDLYVYYGDDQCDHWHREWWMHGPDDEPYTLM